MDGHGPRRLLSVSTAALALCLAIPAGAAAACADTELVPTAETLPVVATATVACSTRSARPTWLMQENAALPTTASLAYSQRLVAESFFAHEAPDGTDVVDRLTAAGYIRPGSGWEVGENLGQGRARLAAQRGQGLDGGPGHKADPLLPRDRHRHRARHAEGRPRRLSTFTTNFGRRDAEPVAERPGSSDSFTKATSAATGATPAQAAKASAAKKGQGQEGQAGPRARPPSAAPLPARRAPRGAPGPQAAPAVERAWTTVRPPERPLTPC